MEAVSTLIVSLVVISLFFSLANYIAWRLFEKPQHALMWSVAFALAGTQYSVNLVRAMGMLSETPYWLLANSISFATVLFALWGHRRRLELPTPRRWLGIAFLTMATVNALIVTFVDTPGYRVAIAPGFTFLIMILITHALLRHPRGDALPQNLAAGAHFFFGLTQVGAATIALSFGAEVAPELLRAYRLTNFALMPSLYVAMGISVILLLATDLSNRLRVQALTDHLTTLSNRRGFLVNCERILARARREGRPVSLILCDLDYFKLVNDRFGHAEGDRALQHFAAILRRTIRSGDEPGRIGGEEFAICLDGMPVEGAAVLARRIQSALAATPLATRKGELVMSASFGVSLAAENDDIGTLLSRADQALYAAKDAGRDTIKLSAEPQNLNTIGVADSSL